MPSRGMLYMTMRGSVMLDEIWHTSVLSRQTCRSTYALVWQDRGTVDIQLVLDRDVVAEDSDVLDTALKVSHGSEGTVAAKFRGRRVPAIATKRSYAQVGDR